METIEARHLVAGSWEGDPERRRANPARRDDVASVAPRGDTTVADLAPVPALERANPIDLVLADGFSCRTQVAFVADRCAIHLAQAPADRLQADGG